MQTVKLNLSLRFVLCFLGTFLFVTGCSNISKEFTDPVFEHPELESKWQGPKEFGAVAARSGWKALQDFKQEKESGNPESRRILDAQYFFDLCRKHDHDSYDPFWGWGIIRGEQAELLSDPVKIERYMKDSVKYLQQALNMSSLPAEERPNVELDLANAYDGLGAFYAFSGNQALSQKNLEEARAILKKLLQAQPENGNIFRIFSFNAFYRKDYQEAQLYREKAEALKLSFPPGYIKELDGFCSSNDF